MIYSMVTLASRSFAIDRKLGTRGRTASLNAWSWCGPPNRAHCLQAAWTSIPMTDHQLSPPGPSASWCLRGSDF